jgi:membrane fusion protein (multidrug efflux system)
MRMSSRANKTPSKRKRMLIMIGLVLLLVLVIVGIKVWTIKTMISSMKPPEAPTVTTIKATYQDWQPSLAAVGTLRAAKGADLAFDVSGVITQVELTSGKGNFSCNFATTTRWPGCGRPKPALRWPRSRSIVTAASSL